MLHNATCATVMVRTDEGDSRSTRSGVQLPADPAF